MNNPTTRNVHSVANICIAPVKKSNQTVVTFILNGVFFDKENNLSDSYIAC